MFPGAGQLNPRYEECLRLHHRWGWFLALGILLMAAGAVAVGAAAFATDVAILTCGILLAVCGAIQIVNAFLVRTWRGFFLHLLSGILHLVVGELMIEHPERAALVLTLMLALAFVIAGALRVLYALAERFAGWQWVVANGAIALLLGISIWRQLPGSSDWVIGLFVGIDLLFGGWSWVMLGLLVKSAAPQLPAPAPPPQVPAGVG
jgi:uncharacterized membrane protein HdeD (DUF308 family)